MEDCGVESIWSNRPNVEEASFSSSYPFTETTSKHSSINKITDADKQLKASCVISFGHKTGSDSLLGIKC